MRMTKLKNYDDYHSSGIMVGKDGKEMPDGKGEFLLAPFDQETYIYKSREIDLQKIPHALKYLYTATVFGTFIAFGMCRGMYGPTLGELQRLTNADLNSISSVFTWVGAGGIVGSLTSGFLFDRFASLPIFVIALFLLGLFTIFIPWCVDLPMLMGVCAVQASLFMTTAVGCNVVAMRLWKKRANSVVLGMHVLFTFGCFLAPIISEPFLTDIIYDAFSGDVTSVNTNNMAAKMADSLTNNTAAGPAIPINNNTSINSVDSASNRNSIDSDQVLPENLQAVHDQGSDTQFAYSEEVSELRLVNGTQTEILSSTSDIFYAYLTVGLFIEVLAMLKLLLLIRYRHVRLPRAIDVEPHVKNISTAIKYSSWAMFALFNIFFGGVETIYMGLLFTFASTHVGMTNAVSSVLVAVTFASHGAGRFVATMVVRCVPIQYIILANLISALLSSATLSYFNVSSELAVWICTILIATGISSIFSCTLLFAREFLHVTGRFTSTYVISYTIGMMTWPVLTAYLLQNRDGVWFPYMETILLSACTLSFLVLFSIQRFCFNSEVKEDQSEQPLPQLKHKLALVQESGVFASLRSLHTI